MVMITMRIKTNREHHHSSGIPIRLIIGVLRIRAISIRIGSRHTNNMQTNDNQLLTIDSDGEGRLINGMLIVIGILILSGILIIIGMLVRITGILLLLIIILAEPC